MMLTLSLSMNTANGNISHLLSALLPGHTEDFIYKEISPLMMNDVGPICRFGIYVYEDGY